METLVKLCLLLGGFLIICTFIRLWYDTHPKRYNLGNVSYEFHWACPVEHCPFEVFTNDETDLYEIRNKHNSYTHGDEQSV